MHLLIEINFKGEEHVIGIKRLAVRKAQPAPKLQGEYVSHL